MPKQNEALDLEFHARMLKRIIHAATPREKLTGTRAHAIVAVLMEVTAGALLELQGFEDRDGEIRKRLTFAISKCVLDFVLAEAEAEIERN